MYSIPCNLVKALWSWAEKWVSFLTEGYRLETQHRNKCPYVSQSPLQLHVCSKDSVLFCVSGKLLSVRASSGRQRLLAHGFRVQGPSLRSCPDAHLCFSYVNVFRTKLFTVWSLKIQDELIQTIFWSWVFPPSPCGLVTTTRLLRWVGWPNQRWCLNPWVTQVVRRVLVLLRWPLSPNWVQWHVERSPRVPQEVTKIAGVPRIRGFSKGQQHSSN